MLLFLNLAIERAVPIQCRLRAGLLVHTFDKTIGETLRRLWPRVVHGSKAISSPRNKGKELVAAKLGV